MSDMMSRIRDDEEEYLALCKKFGEKPIDCYSTHATELQKRAYPERYTETREVKQKKQNIETEVKIPVSIKKFKTVITDCFGDRAPKFEEERNTFYSVPNGFLRLRNYAGEISVTYKGKREESEKFNCREEIEFIHLEKDFEKLKTFFSRIGLEKYFEYTKQRANYDVEGGMSGGYFATISFDILPNGKRYIEVERKEAGGEEIVENILKRLDIDKCPIEKRSYLEIVRSGA